MKASTKIQPKPAKKFPVWLIFLIGAGVLLGAVVVIVSARATTPTVAPQVTGGPALQVDKEKVDLGTIALGNTIEVKFDVANVGDQPLIFTQAPYLEVVKGCCPQQPAIGQRMLNPGEHTTVSFPMMMHTGMGGFHDFRLHLPTNVQGQSDKTVQVLSNWQ